MSSSKDFLTSGISSLGSFLFFVAFDWFLMKVVWNSYFDSSMNSLNSCAEGIVSLCVSAFFLTP